MKNNRPYPVSHGKINILENCCGYFKQGGHCDKGGFLPDCRIRIEFFFIHEF
jgi:hypothetical protein